MFFFRASPSFAIIDVSLTLQIYAHESELVDYWVQEPNVVDYWVQEPNAVAMPTGEDPDAASTDVCMQEYHVAVSLVDLTAAAAASADDERVSPPPPPIIDLTTAASDDEMVSNTRRSIAHESELVDYWVQEPNAVDHDVKVLLDHLMPTGEDPDAASSMATARCHRAQATTGATTAATTAATITDDSCTRKFLYSDREDFRNAVTITSNDWDRLEPGIYLNDSCIDVYTRHLQASLSPNIKMHVFSALFFGGCVIRSWEYAACSGWTKKVDVFDKDLLLFPLVGQSHWSLLCIVKPGQLALRSVNLVRGVKHLDGEGCVMIMDSIHGFHSMKKYAKPILDFLWNDWLFKKSYEFNITQDEMPKMKKHFKSARNIQCKVNILSKLLFHVILLLFLLRYLSKLEELSAELLFARILNYFLNYYQPYYLALIQLISLGSTSAKTCIAKRMQ